MSIEKNGRLAPMWDDCIVDVESRGYVYSLSLMIAKLLRDLDHFDNDEEVALEWIDYNVIGFFVCSESDYTPMIIDDYNHELNDLVIYGEIQC